MQKIKLKIKTHKGTAKRVKLTASGNAMHKKRGLTHFNQKKSASRKRASAVMAPITGGIKKKIKRALGV